MRRLFTTIALMIAVGLVFSVGGQLNAIELKGKIVWTGWSSGIEAEVNKEIMEVFERKHPGTKIKYIVLPWERYLDKVITMIAGGTPPDIIFADAFMAYPLYKRGLLLPIDDVLVGYPERNDENLYMTVGNNLFKWDGHYYALPWLLESFVLYFNKTLFDKVGLGYPSYDIDHPWTWEDFLAAAQKLTVRENDKTVQWGFQLIPSHIFWRLLVTSFGGEAVDKYIEPTICLLDSREAVAALQFMQDLVHKYRVAPSPAFVAVGAEPWEAGISAMDINGHWCVNWRRDITAFKWDIAPLPMGKRNVTPFESASHVVLKSTKSPELAKAYLNFYGSDEAQKILMATGLWIPVNRTLLKPGTMYTAQPGSPPEHLLIAAKILELERDTYPNDILHRNYKEIIDKVWPPPIELLMLNKQSAEEAAKVLVRETNKLLK